MTKKLFALVLACLFACSALPFAVLAEDAAPSDAPIDEALPEDNASEMIEKDGYSTEIIETMEEGTSVTIGLNFLPESEIASSEVGDILVTLVGDLTHEVVTVLLTEENNRTATITLTDYLYDVTFSGHDVDGYICDELDDFDWIFPEEGDRIWDVAYIKDELDITLHLAFEDGNPFTYSDFDNLILMVGDPNNPNERTTYPLNEENNYSQTLTLQSRQYFTAVYGLEKDGYAVIGAREYIHYQAGKSFTEDILVTHLANNGLCEFNVSLSFTNPELLKDDDVFYVDFNCDDSAPVEPLVLNRGNGFAGTAYLPSGSTDAFLSTAPQSGAFVSFDDSSYYRYHYEGKSYSWESEATIFVGDASLELSINQDKADANDRELYNALTGSLIHYDSGCYIDFTYNGEDDFSTLFENLPAGSYELYMYPSEKTEIVGYNADFSCENPYEDWEEEFSFLSLEFDVNDSQKRSISVDLKTLLPRGTVNVVAEIDADDALKQEIADTLYVYLQTYAGIPNRYFANYFTRLDADTLSGKMENLSEESYHLGASTTLKDYKLDFVFHDENGEEISHITPKSDAPQTVYLTVTPKKENYYLNLDFSFAAESDLQKEDIGTINVLILDDKTLSMFAFNEENGYNQTLALQGKNLRVKIEGLERDGYILTSTQKEEHKYIPVPWDDYYAEHYLWSPGDLRSYSYVLNYRKTEGKLTVRGEAPGLFSEFYGDEVRLYNEAGQQIDTGFFFGNECEFNLNTPGTYTVRIDAARSQFQKNVVCETEKTFTFDPAEGKTVVLKSYVEDMTTIRFTKFFATESALKEEDFPEGIRVIAENADNGDTYEVLLNAKNNWTDLLYVPAGLYSFTEVGTDRAGYTHTMETSVLRIDYFFQEGGGGGPVDSEYAMQKATGDAYCLRDWKEGASDHNYFSISKYKPVGTSITIKNDDFFSIYQGALLESHPNTGFEVKSYNYTLTVNGQTHRFTLAPGESFSLDELPAGSNFTVTAEPPQNFPWNMPVTVVQGTLSAGSSSSPEEEKNEVNIQNDYFYLFDEDGVTLNLYKTNEDGTALAGAVFGLYGDAECKTLIAKNTSDENGRLSFTAEQAGTYYVKELEAPDGYVLSDKVSTFVVASDWTLQERQGANGQDKVIVETLTITEADAEEVGDNTWKITNKKVEDETPSDKPAAPMTGDSLNGFSLVFPLIFSLCGMYTLVQKRSVKKEEDIL